MSRETADAIMKMNDPSLKDYVRGRAYEADGLAPAPTRDGDYMQAVREGLFQARAIGNPLPYRVAAVTCDLLGDINTRIALVPEPEKPDIIAIAHLAALLPDIREEIRNVPDALTKLPDIAMNWAFRGTKDSPIAGRARYFLNMLIAVVKPGDDTTPWLRLWNQEEKPYLWTLGHLGLLRADIHQGLQELPTLIKRIRVGDTTELRTDWNVYDATWAPYASCIAPQPDNFASLVKQVQLLSLVDRTAFVSSLLTNGAKEEHLAQLR